VTFFKDESYSDDFQIAEYYNDIYLTDLFSFFLHVFTLFSMEKRFFVGSGRSIYIVEK
jgi:hypothetical protein